MHLPIKKRMVSECKNAEDAGTSAFDSSTVPTEANNCASGSSTGNCYDVFLSFRGLDTREGFSDHLYHGLVDAGVVAFRDDDELHLGEEIGSELLASIKNSKILIPVLSVNYGSSRWCLDELFQMMECKNNNKGHLVLPIFYKVKAAHVRHQIGDFGKAFHSREKYFDQTTMEKWRQALFRVSSLKGLAATGYEGNLVKLAVQKVLSKLKEEFELVLPENLVGIDNHVKKVMEFIDKDSSATLFIGICGMGGIGKTTLAKTFYNKLSNQFEYRSFIEDVRESCEHNDGLKRLQNQVISDILKKKVEVRHKDEGTRFLSSKCKFKKVLLLLDDVDHHDQLKALAGNHNWFSSGSRILITTRNKSILDSAWVDYNYELEGMDDNQSLILFSRHAFLKNYPPSEYDDLARRVVSTTGGLPLSLVVLGSYLCGKERTVWTGTIEKSLKIPHREVRKKLMISYEALEYEQKQIFLDIACFFSIGVEKRMVSCMWEACGFFPKEGIEVLRFLSLLKVGDKHELRMHDQLRDLGKDIVREENHEEPQHRSRLWDPEEVLKVVDGDKGTKEIKAIYLRKRNSEDAGETADQGVDIHINEQFKKLTNLRFLHMSGVHFSGDFKNSSEELRWLGLLNCPSTFGANDFHAKELAVLDLSWSEISEEWRGWNSIMMAKKLKFLNLSYCTSLKGTFFLSAFKNLEFLVLQHCENVKQIHSSIGDMKGLECLDLTRCLSLKELPVEVGKLGALEQLFLTGCAIKELPNSIGDLQNLELLNISLTEIEELPSGIGRLQKLRRLDAAFCNNLRGGLPESICHLSSLEHLNFVGCPNLQSFPELPSSLKYLSITCQSRRLPSLSHLTDLQELRLQDCTFLEFCELPSTTLGLSECSQLTDVEESELPKSLCTPLKLEILLLERCFFMQTLDVSQFSHLRKLSVLFCSNIEVRGLDKLKYLEDLTITGCTTIERLDLAKFEGLKILDTRLCRNLVEIEGLDRLKFLEEINIHDCLSIERLDLSKSKSLKVIDVGYCNDAIKIQGLDRLEFLQKLCISGCASFKRLNLQRSQGMTSLYAENCKNLVGIQGLDRLKFLEELHISECISMERLDLSKSEGMKIIHAENCENLVEIEGLDRLRFLEELHISGCVSIERLDLPKSEVMKRLYAENCKNLVEIQGLDRLELLEELNISGCSSLDRLEFPKYENLIILDGENREEIYVNHEQRCVNFRVLLVLILVVSSFIFSHVMM